MTKTLSLPEIVYDDLISLSDELTHMAKKPISVSMSVHLLMEVYRAHVSNPCALDMFRQQLASLDLMSPQEFDQVWDDVPSKKSLKKK